MSLCKDCVKGVTHEGTPQGKWEKIGGIDSYVATPSGEYPKDKVILYLADGFGPQLPNAQLMADDFAATGLKTIIPDYFNGDPIPADALDNPEPTIDLPAWLRKHTQEAIRPILDKVVEALKADGVTSFAATGYCLGGRSVFDLAFENIIKVAAASHPSFLKIPEDLEKYLATSKAPLLINSCTFDEQFPPESSAKADEILGGGKFVPGYKGVYFEGCTHGFAVRGDMNDAKVKAGKEGAFKSTAEWFLNKL
ncbi:chlorocatechol-degradation protein [Phlegmacium glaucopus]|nr:chlorocatechol-degradation protein [Phlegmacium glaucopus]